MHIQPVILSGGTGTRLWPLSRAEHPKQFLSLTSENSLLQETLLRFRSNSFELPLILCNSAHRFTVAEQIKDINVNILDIILERYGRNTAPAATIAAMFLSKIDTEALILLLPSDHRIASQNALETAINTALPAAKEGHIVTFGVRPSRPETGYGYILHKDEIGFAPGCFIIQRFIEKPDLKKAEEMINNEICSWNSGIFLFKASTYLKEIKRLQPAISLACKRSLDNATRDLGFLRLDEESFKKCPKISIDYAIMERTNKAAIVPVDMGWNDIGSWSELWAISDKDSGGNVIKGDVFVEDTTGSYIKTYNKMVATVGLKDMVVVDTGDTVLVAPKNRAQDVGSIVRRLEKEGRTEHILPGRVRRPWGWYQMLDRGASFQVKRICVNPKARLSLQRHLHRAEHWVVVSGEAKVYCDGRETILGENQSTYIPVGASHRLENSGDEPLYLIEVQSGNYLGEDDIERLEDDFARK